MSAHTRTLPTPDPSAAGTPPRARLRTGLSGMLLVGVCLCAIPAAAQDYSYPTALPHGAAPSTPPAVRPGHIPGVGPSYPSSAQSSNISPYDTRSAIAPRLPTPAAGEDGAPRRFLIDARRALAAGRTGEAQEALERAETRLLDRSTPAFVTNQPSRRPLVGAIHAALQALSAGDRARALSIVDGALARTGPPRAGMPRGGVPQGGMPRAGMPYGQPGAQPGAGAGMPPYPSSYPPGPYGGPYSPRPYPYPAPYPPPSGD
ncbi:hypothetical protein [Acidisphaera rubrifaciens]|uniref:Uncharacterized protein n=1 Tax=Acidisphaera rubrifaciens HS-AP3 TaxID=1231350 RepID=A0A0D6P3M6_9PROT|nr:hypothetical protein [Acidisphaera rubrifaciens]GAN75793.1 hypothetical protein Asru_0006_05 [Acidisphaera rubrifaciens HS-AP3]